MQVPPPHPSRFTQAHVAHFDVRYATPIGRLMTGNERLRSTRPVFLQAVPAIRDAANAIQRHKTLIELSYNRLNVDVRLEVEEQLEKQEVLRQLRAQLIIASNVVNALRYAQSQLESDDACLIEPWPDQINFTDELHWWGPPVE
eukprot:7405285-Pyramimonas_sp.AAC.1